MFAPVDIAPLVYFRIIFGSIMLCEVYRYFSHGWIERYYIRPLFYFKYYGFDWIDPLPVGLMYVHFVFLGLLAACILTGFLYRPATVLFCLGFNYVFLIDQANYLNHFYLISLLSLVLIVLPANRAGSLDVVRRPETRSRTAPAWTLWLLRFQLAVPYIFGGIAKINGDWLRGEPMRAWLANRTDFPLIGSLFTEEWMVYLFAYGGLLFDLMIVPLLLWRKTRWIGLIWLLTFHLLNFGLFNIGVFPWLMLLAAPVFFGTNWLRRAVSLFGIGKVSPGSTETAEATVFPVRSWVIVGIGAFVAFQVLFPMRHLLYPGNPSWTEEGHRFSWRMKLRDKDSEATFLVVDSQTKEEWVVSANEYLTRRQAGEMQSRPDMILQYGSFLAQVWKFKGHDSVEVYATVEASLNGRDAQLLIDPEIDLVPLRRSLQHSDWIRPLHEPLQSDSTRENAVSSSEDRGVGES